MFRISVLIILLFYISGCSTNNDEVISKSLDQYEKEYEKLCVNMGENVWSFYTDSTFHSLDEPRQQFAVFFKNDTLLNDIKNWSLIENIHNDTLKKRIELWNNILDCAQANFDNEIMALQDKLENDISQNEITDELKEKVRAGLHELVLLRNAKARELGYDNYAHMVLQTTGIDTTWFYSTINKIDSLTLPAYTDIVNKIHAENNTTDIEYNHVRNYIIDGLRLTDIPQIDNSEKEILMRRILSGIGIDLEKLAIDFKVTKLPPGIGGFGNCVSIPDDFRVVVMKDLSFRYWLHEIGHGLNWMNVKQTYPVLKGYEWCKGNLCDLYSEAMAETIERFSEAPNWLIEAGVPQQQQDSLRNVAETVFPVVVRWKLINLMFEIEMYKHPDESPMQIMNVLWEKYLQINNMYTRPLNLVQLAYISYPVYIQNYLFANILSWQIHSYLRKTYGDNYTNNSETTKYFINNLWSPGELFDWQTKLQKATGSKLDVEGYIYSSGQL